MIRLFVSWIQAHLDAPASSAGQAYHIGHDGIWAFCEAVSPNTVMLYDPQVYRPPPPSTRNCATYQSRRSHCFSSVAISLSPGAGQVSGHTVGMVDPSVNGSNRAVGVLARRKPTLLFLLPGLFLLRLADRQFLALLFQLPPRITRFEPLYDTCPSNEGASEPEAVGKAEMLEHASHTHCQLCFGY